MVGAMSRRGFLGAGGGVLAAAALAPAGAADAPAKKRPLRKAIMYATIGHPGAGLEKFRAVKAAGLEGVEPMSHMGPDEGLRGLEAAGPKAGTGCCHTPLG